METPEKPADEAERIEALLELALLDTPPEAELDRCVKLAAELCGASIGAISLVDRERQWFKAVYGHLPPETPRDVSFCGHAIAHDDVLVVNDALKDPRFADNPLVAAPDGIRFYAGFPLRGRDGQPLGTLCVIHDTPHELTDAHATALRVIVEHIESFLMVRLVALRAASIAQNSRDEKDTLASLDARRRETTAMVAHDLKNPLAVVSLLTEHIRSLPLPPKAREALDDLAASTETAERMVLDLLDVARSDSGQVPVDIRDTNLPSVVARLAKRVSILATQRGLRLAVEDELATPIVRVDSVLLARAIRNLVDNAVKYAPEGGVVRIRLREKGDAVIVRVEDDGATIPADQRRRIFEPFVGGAGGARPSHGLGLAFCERVADVHGGRVWVEPLHDDETGNAFCLSLPRRPPEA